jgi:hypothetical protein
MERISPVLLGNALIWLAAITATAILIRGTEQAETVTVILAGAAGASNILVRHGLRQVQARRSRPDKKGVE